ncbi:MULTISPECIES: hypothetical protein [Dysgonomonas]|uniref:hypothetical protein n=1 Tax=Dysgonomonas TaxID=156973 RepID=UPI0009268A0D|nr:MULTISPECIES: hypothetical protein [Dysgonomonas]MBN9303004.1 hypothetical protein [Dysgonomonas mossii]OJX64004.1 MAG: hypothetical protein BGO84_08420 [Dysgonomonas sp. 37-18]
MKRFLSVLLSLITLIILVAGAHPVLAMHFCAGDFYSVNLAKPNQTNHSCCDKMKNMSKDNCENEPKSDHTSQTSLVEDYNNCCSFNHVQLSTDDYNYQVQQTNLNNTLPFFINVWFVFYSIFKDFEFDSTVTIKHIFPPGGLSKLNIDLLSYICIYRI